MLNPISSTAVIASTGRRARRRDWNAYRATTAPGMSSFGSSHGSTAISAKHEYALRRGGRGATRKASNAAPHSAAAADSSGYTAVDQPTSGGDSPTASVAPIAQGSGTTRTASRY